MEVIAAIQDAEAQLVQTLQELNLYRELTANLENDVKKLRLEIAGLTSFAQRQGLESGKTAPHADVLPISPDIDLVGDSGPNLALLSRNDAVATILRSAGTALDRATIHEYMVDGGRFESLNDISLSLTGLKRANRVDKLGRGLWQIADETSQTNVR